MSIEEVDSAFRVYGDNILETELIIHWIKRGKNIENVDIEGTEDRPIYVFEDSMAECRFAIQLCPGYERWDISPIEGKFSEKPDIVMTHIEENGEESNIILAIESCDAVQAGNQAWQRFRRAMDASDNQIPYIYLLPLVDWEHTKDGRELKNPRYQSAQITWGQLSLCSERGAPSLQVYKLSSWTDYARNEGYPLPNEYEEFKGTENGVKYLLNLLRERYGSTKKRSKQEILEDIIFEMRSVAERYSDYNNTKLPVYLDHPFLNSNNQKIVDEYAESIIEGREVQGDIAIHQIDLEDFQTSGSVFQKRAQRRTCSDKFYDNILEKINWKDSAKKDEKINYLKSWGVDADESYTGKELNELVRKEFGKTPVSYKKPPSEAVIINNRTRFRKMIDETYPELDNDILEWIGDSENPMLFVPLYGYKPSGDSRPDRGLLPLLVAMFPKIAEETFVIMYSNRTPKNWEEILERGGNELWNVIRKYSDAIVVDVNDKGVMLNED